MVPTPEIKPYACESSFLVALLTTTTCSYIASPQAYPCLLKGLSTKHLHVAVPPAQLWEADNKLHLCANNSSSFGFCSFCSLTLVFKKNNLKKIIAVCKGHSEGLAGISGILQYKYG